MTVKVDDREWRRFKERIAELGGAEVRIGVLASRGGGAVVEGGDITLVELMAIHELGSEAAGIPARRPIGLTVEQKEQEIADVVLKVARAVALDKMDARRGLDLIGAFTSTEIKKTITDGPSLEPPLQPRTIERKGSSRALVDTGRLVASITWETIVGGAAQDAEAPSP